MVIEVGRMNLGGGGVVCMTSAGGTSPRELSLLQAQLPGPSSPFQRWSLESDHEKLEHSSSCFFLYYQAARG